MRGSALRGLLMVVLAAMVLLHNDFWFWDDPRLVLGLPIGLTYHIAFCVAASALMFLLARFAWPRNLEVGEDEEDGP